MQHIVNIFIGDELVSFRDRFAAYFRDNNVGEDPSYFTALSLTIRSDGALEFRCDEKGDERDTQRYEGNNSVALINYFGSLFQRKVTIAHPGNSSMIVEIWGTLYSDEHIDVVRAIIDAIKECRSKFYIEITGFTNEAVSCFIPNAEERNSPDIYCKIFEKNMTELLSLRESLSALRLIENKNQQGVSLDLDENTLARVCAEYMAILSRNYLSLTQTVGSLDAPLESWGISAIKFDRNYFIEYIRNKVLISKLQEQGVDHLSFNINTLATRTNPVIKGIFKEINDFHKAVIDAQAKLSINGACDDSSVVSEIDEKLAPIQYHLEQKIEELFQDDKITFFERESLLSLMLGEDCSMFDTSPVQANELIVDDIIDDSMQFFVDLDKDEEYLKDVTIDKVKVIRNKMRNTAIANRQREEELDALGEIQESDNSIAHIEGNKYSLGGINYKLNLEIDDEPLEKIYEPHTTVLKSVDLRAHFGKIRSQGEQGSCAAFAVASVIEAFTRDGKQYSPAFIYYNARIPNNGTNSDCGSTIYHALKVASEDGICIEELMPYNDAVFNVAPSQSATEEAGKCKVTEAKSINIKDGKLAALKSALADGYPVIVAARIFDSFSDTISGFVRHPSAEEINGVGKSNRHGHHAMVVCGFSDDEKVFVVRNSWGESFGEKGYCYIPYSYAEKYFLQACIITKISSNEQKGEKVQQTLRFDTNDAKIKQAILINLIAEDNIRLEDLSCESDELKRSWSRNEGALGNVNLQTILSENEYKRIDNQISRLKGEMTGLEESLVPKCNKYKYKLIRKFFVLFGIALVGWGLVCVCPVTLFFVISIILSLITIFYPFAAYKFKYLCYRQELKDEIKIIADKISVLEQEKRHKRINAHIHGTIIQRFVNLRNNLQKRKQQLHNFNQEMVKVYHAKCAALKKMSPHMPYPFLSIIDNSSIDRYFEIRCQKLISAFDVDNLFKNYDPSKSLIDIIANDVRLNSVLNCDIVKFSMSLLVNNVDKSKWQFLPDRNMLNKIITDLDNRAAPFCTYYADYDKRGKYIFFKGANNETITPVIRFFSQRPMPIDDPDIDSITILNIIRYNLSTQTGN